MSRGVLLFAGLLGGTACSDFALEPDRIPTQLVVSPTDTTLVTGESAQLRVSVLDQDGNPFDAIPVWAPVWSVSDPDAVTITGSGEVLATGGGEVRADVEIAGLTERVSLRVNPSSVLLSAPVIYLTQGAQNLEGTVTLLAGRPAFLRVFVTGGEASFYEPTVRASFFFNDVETHAVLMESFSYVTPSTVDESTLDRSYSALIPASIIRTGVEMVVDLDPGGLIPLAGGSQVRIPASGRTRLDVVDAPLMSLTIVPVLIESAPDPRVFTWTSGINPDSEQLKLLRALMPIGDIEVIEHATYTTSSDLTTEAGWSGFLREMSALRVLDGADSYYYGTVTLPSGSRWGGLGYIGRPVSVGAPRDRTLTHEVGHNMNLRHVTCGGAGSPDPNYPYEGGSIGIWGYDLSGAGRLITPSQYKDVMGYCNPKWISDYHFMKALNFRQATESPAAIAAPEEVLFLWGSAGDDELTLEPTFVLDAPPTLPSEDGPYRIEGLDATGGRLFSLSFSPDETEFGPGHFVFAIPYEPGWRDALARITLSGPGGAAVLRSVSGPPAMAIVRDPGDRRVRAIVRDPGDLTRFGDNADILLSDGLRTRQVGIRPR